mmetsp:Transcript_106099/g.306936  ORF Transcript_106099/g.306936 Transcript_106099/m.306936 type:complete len:464 (-) Transcript_106099:140-1531(-)
MAQAGNGPQSGLIKSLQSMPMPEHHDDTTLCPQPVRPYTSESQVPASPGEDRSSRSPGFAADTELAALWENDATTRPAKNEIMATDSRAVGGCDVHAGDRRPLSAVSTSAATPSPEGRAASPHPWPQTPDSQQISSPQAIGGGAPSGTLNSTTRRRGGNASGSPRTGDATNPSAAGGNSGGGRRESDPKKVFVGGVPQETTQEDLYTIFGQFGNVRKAWLQSCRAAGRTTMAQPHNHRGFGFVIFSDKSAVDNLLGSSKSQYLSVGSRRLEVKRAVASSELPGRPGPMGSPSQPRGGGGGNGGSSGRGGHTSSPLGPVMGGCGHHEQLGLTASMPPPLPMPAGSVLPMPAAMQAAPPVQPWATHLGFQASMGGSQTMTMPQMSHASAMGQQPMMMPMQYPSSYSAFPHAMAMGQHQQDPMQALAHQGLHAGFHMPYGLQVMGPQGTVQQSAVFQAQQQLHRQT